MRSMVLLAQLIKVPDRDDLILEAVNEKCAAYMLQVLNDFCAELPSSGENCYIYRNILEEAREGLPYRYIGLRA